jgi:hypothetical protein
MRLQTLLMPLLPVVFALFAAGEAAAESRNCYIVNTGNGSERVCERAEEWAQWGPDTDWEFDCRFGECDLCGNCHAPPKGYPKVAGTPIDHVKKFIYQPKPAERLTWADGRATLTQKDGKYCVVSSNKTLFCLSQGAYLLKNLKSEVIGALTPAAGKLSPGTVVKPVAPIKQPGT